jgi:hypothetical protein
LLEREFRGRDSELDEAAHLLDLFAVDVLIGFEVLDFTRDAARELPSVELFDAGNPVLPLANSLPGFLGANAKRA